jgi:prepilin-type N-terminal cleavage/methylation domain-containing protein
MGPVDGRRGFTLLELLTVVAIMAVMMGLATAGFLSMRRGAGMRAALLSVKSSLVQARQFAITRRVRTHFRYGNTLPDSELGERGYFVLSTNAVDGEIMNTSYLSPGVIFTDESGGDLTADKNIVFKLDGSCMFPPGGRTGVLLSHHRIVMVEKQRSGVATLSITNVIEIHSYTGKAKVEDLDVFQRHR